VPGQDEPAAWITEDVVPVPKNIYGITKLAAENLCELIHRKSGLPCLILRTARFFPDEDDDRSTRQRYSDGNLKVNELLHRRADLEDVAAAHILAITRAPVLGLDRMIISATTPFAREDVARLRFDALPEVLRVCPDCQPEYAKRGWSLPTAIDRVYVNERARVKLGWRPKYDFSSVVRQLVRGEDYRSPLARAVGAKMYHRERFADGPYPVA
jgi:nucleoside-diphosphate-sugar epimerase